MDIYAKSKGPVVKREQWHTEERMLFLQSKN